MKKFRDAAGTPSACLVYLSISLSLLGRYGFDAGARRSGSMSAAAITLMAAMVVVIFDMRRAERRCVAGR